MPLASHSRVRVIVPLMSLRDVTLLILAAGLTGPVSGQSSPNEQTSQSVIQRPPLSAAASCEGLASLTLPGATITLARAIDAGALTSYTPAGGQGAAVPASQAVTLPAFCRVAATLRPSSDSDIKIEVWMPAVNWNGKFRGAWRTPPKCTVRTVCSRRRGWRTAAAEKDRTRSIWSLRSSSGSSRASHPIGSSPPTQPMGSSTVHGHCVRTRRWLRITASGSQEVRTRPQALSAGHSNQ